MSTGCSVLRLTTCDEEFQKQRRRDDTLEWLRETKIPELGFSQSSIHDVAHFLHKASVAADPQGEGIRFIVDLRGLDEHLQESADTLDDPFAGALSPGTPVESPPVDTNALPRVTMSAKMITFEETLRIVTSITWLRYEVGDRTVRIVPPRLLPEDVECLILHGLHPDVVWEIFTGSGETFATVGAERVEHELIASFRSMCIPFPPGSSVNYVPGIGVLIVRNSRENLAMVRDLIGECWPRARMMDKMHDTVFPKLDFRRESASSVLADLAEISRKHDPQDPKGGGIDMVFENTDELENKRITFRSGAISFADALDAVCSLLGCGYEIQGHVVIIKDGI